MRYEAGQVYRAIVNGTATLVVVTAVIHPGTQGTTGQARIRVRDLQGTAEEFDLLESAISNRVNFSELCTWFLKQKWNAEDIGRYLDDYGVAFRNGTLAAYCSNFQNYGNCNGSSVRARKGTEEVARLGTGVEERCNDKLAYLSALVQACGGITGIRHCLMLIEQCGGVRQVQQVINLLGTGVT